MKHKNNNEGRRFCKKTARGKKKGIAVVSTTPRGGGKSGLLFSVGLFPNWKELETGGVLSSETGPKKRSSEKYAACRKKSAHEKRCKKNPWGVSRQGKKGPCADLLDKEKGTAFFWGGKGLQSPQVKALTARERVGKGKTLRWKAPAKERGSEGKRLFRKPPKKKPWRTRPKTFREKKGESQCK